MHTSLIHSSFRNIQILFQHFLKVSNFMTTRIFEIWKMSHALLGSPFLFLVYFVLYKVMGLSFEDDPQ